MIPKAAEVRLTPEDRAVLEARLRAPTTEQRDVLRARIVLLAGEGRLTRSIARMLETMPRTVSVASRMRCADRRGLPRPTRPHRRGAGRDRRAEQAPDVDEDRYKLVIDGLIENSKAWTLEELYALPQETQITRLVCIEGGVRSASGPARPSGSFCAASAPI
jgi:DMSO/TMAO reductase YedYZ molybdopterin-dependent catalytic subunit